jgi:hypothetical protein
MLRAIGDEEMMLRLCYVRTGRSTDMFSFISGMSSVSPLQAREVYYRVTGEAFNLQPRPEALFRRGQLWSGPEFDGEQATDAVGGRLRDLSLASSRFDGSIDPQAALGYGEWTLVMKNEGSMTREARAHVALPPGAVVSRLTLWINGEEREAAFAARGQVTAAYRSVVQRQRDPVLVTTAGADRIAVHMFPVPSHGEMKVRIGMTMPMQLDNLRQGTLQLPYFHERNFEVADDFRHAVLLESKSTLRSANGESRVTANGAHSVQLQLADSRLASADGVVTVARSRSDIAWTADKLESTSFIKQALQVVPAFRPSRLVVVLDSSASMAPSAKDFAAALSRLPADIELFVVVADDEIEPHEPPRRTTPSDAATLVRDYDYVGGKDNTAALDRALGVASAKQDSALLWIHGPQPVVLRTTASIEQRLERNGKLRWYDVQTTPGPNRIGERLESIRKVHALSLAKLQDMFERWRTGGSEVIAHRERVTATEPPGSIETQTSSHLARLWANDEVGRLLYSERALRQSAVELAHRYQLVTPVTGAVVLETQQQYDAAGLTPVPEGTVPSIPEPEEWALIAIAIAVLLYALRRRTVRQHAAI